MLLECEQQTGAVLTGNSFPGQTGKSAFQCPQKIETCVGTSLPDASIGGNGAELTELRKGSNAGKSEHLLRFGAQIWDLSETRVALHARCAWVAPLS